MTEPSENVGTIAETCANAVPTKLSRALILDELFDLTLYRRLRTTAKIQERDLLNELIPIEAKHLEFWQTFFQRPIDKLDLGRKVKLELMVALARIFGHRFVHLLLESIEVYGIQKYFTVWEIYKHTPLAEAVEGILREELKHEDEIVSRIVARQLNGEKIRNIFLGLNDGLVEILGAVSGFFAAFQNTNQVFVAGLTVAVAGAFSMAAGVFVSSGSQKEVEWMHRERLKFLGESKGEDDEGVRPLKQAVIVGMAYLFGSVVPILPVFFGAKTVVASILAAGSMIMLVSMILSFISGMNIKRRVFTNVIIMALAVVITYGIGYAAKVIWGI